MKRFITLLLAMVMALSLVVPAWAADANLTNQQGQTSTKQPVNVLINKADPVYQVTVTWETLTFTYARGSWNTGSHKYDNSGWQVDDGRTEATSAKVTVTNHSNADIWYTASLANGTNIGNVAVGLNGTSNTTLENEKVIACPVNAEPTPQGFTVNISGDPTNDAHILENAAATTIKQLTVQIFTTDQTPVMPS